MDNFPSSYKNQVTYSEIGFDNTEGSKYYDETIRHFCKQETLDDYKTAQLSYLEAMQAQNKEAIIASIQEEIDWVEGGSN